jgi:hypothetical protein
MNIINNWPNSYIYPGRWTIFTFIYIYILNIISILRSLYLYTIILIINTLTVYSTRPCRCRMTYWWIRLLLDGIVARRWDKLTAATRATATVSPKGVKFPRDFSCQAKTFRPCTLRPVITRFHTAKMPCWRNMHLLLPCIGSYLSELE